MSLLSRFFGRRGEDPYQEGIALYESGRFAEAVPVLRRAAVDAHGTATGSLATFHLRQALLREGRRLLRAGQAEQAVPLLDEAAAEADYPDLRFWSGAARGLAGDWEGALAAAHAALRRKPDYPEARLLEACALARLERPAEAANSLDQLVESGRRLQHPLVTALSRSGGYSAADLPTDLGRRLEEIVSGQDQDESLAAAVALCRAGEWDEGVRALRSLVAGHPGYPDYRVRLAAALFQQGELAEAEREVVQALAINPRFRSAVHLQALILADRHRLAAAAGVLAAFQTPDEGSRRDHEELFAAYLRSVLALLTGHRHAVDRILDRWGDLTRSFPRAEMLRAAADDLAGRHAAAAGRLAALTAAWPGDVEYLHWRTCLLLSLGDLDGAEKALARWPAGQEHSTDERPSLLSARLALARGEPESALALLSSLESGGSGIAARWLEAEAAAGQGDWQALQVSIQGLLDEGLVTERAVGLLVRARTQLAGAPAAAGSAPGWLPPAVLPETVVADLVPYLHAAGRSDEAAAILRPLAGLHPEDLRWVWLEPATWLAPVRRWIS
jgi:tetratricopeptide (TPR) repeat protein